MTNPILEEIHEFRRQLQIEHAEDMEDYPRRELERTKTAGHPVARIEQRAVRPDFTVGAENAGDE